MSPQAGSVLLNEVAPRLRAYTRGLKKVGADDHDELWSDGIAIAAKMLDSAERRGKVVPAAKVAAFAAKHLAVGRRSTSGGRTDACSPAAQLDGKSRLASMQARAGRDPDSGEPSLFGDSVGGDAEDPSQAAARNIDWGVFMAGLDDLSRDLVEAFACGQTARSLKESTGLSDSGLAGRRKKLAAAVRDYFGEGCLADAARAPMWAIDVYAHRQREACRGDAAAR